MHGNVWEWVQDWYGKYGRDSQRDPLGASSGRSGVLRGGSWGSIERDLRSANRHGLLDPKATRLVDAGFRLVRTAR